MQDVRAVRVLAALGPGDDPLAAALDRVPAVDLVARCDAVEDLLVTAATGVAQVALLSPYLEGLDRDVLARLEASGLAVVGVTSGEEQEERRLRQLGVASVHPRHRGVAALVDVLHDAVSDREAARAERAYANPFAAVPLPTAPAGGPEDRPGGGRVVAVWGPTGAPGRSTVAAGLAAELALLGWPTLLVDADVYGGTLAPALGLLDESSGLATACRAANVGALDVPGLRDLVVPLARELSLLTGLPAAERWPELRPAAVEVVLSLSRTLAAVTVVDCGFSLEQDEELSYDTLAPRRNGATLAVLGEADLVVVVGSADRLGVRRLVQALGDLEQAVPGARTSVVANRVRPGDDEREVREALRRFAGLDRVTPLPLDLAATDAALRASRLLPQAAPTAPLRSALQQYAGSLVAPAPAPVSRPRRLLAR